jgi:hypothetical protein
MTAYQPKPLWQFAKSVQYPHHAVKRDHIRTPING